MPDLLDCLGIRGRRLRLVVAGAIWIGFGAAMVAIAAVQAVVEWAVGASTVEIVAVVLAMWVAWTVWHSHLFAIHREEYLSSGRTFPYRRAFIRDIFPGITIGFSQMLRPAWNGTNLRAGLFPRLAETAGGITEQVAGLVVFAGAFALFSGAWHTLGAARVGFASEFADTSLFEPVRRGPYGRVRHPLFWSGIGVSWSLALLTRTTVGIVVAVVNNVYGLFYNSLEDRRLCLVFGARYERYSKEVARIIPIRGIAMRRSSAGR